MAQIIVSPKEMRVFARYLEELADVIRQRKARVHDRLNALHQTWRDEKYRQFEKDLQENSQELDHFIKSARAYARFLDMKAARADRYLKR
jgi:uncharacterized protein YukE